MSASRTRRPSAFSWRFFGAGQGGFGGGLLVSLLLLLLLPTTSQAWLSSSASLPTRRCGVSTAHRLFYHGAGSSSPDSSACSFSCLSFSSNDQNNSNNNDIIEQQRRSNQQSQQDLWEFMQKPMSSTVGDAPNNRMAGTNILEQDEDLSKLVKCIVQAADGRKAEDIVALEIHHISTVASVLILLSGNSRPQNQAIANVICDDVSEHFHGNLQPRNNGVPEGTAESGWMVLDFGSVLVNVMTPKSRLFYNVQGQWLDRGAREIDISSYLLQPAVDEPTTSKDEPTMGKSWAEPTDPEDDPFWS